MDTGSSDFKSALCRNNSFYSTKSGFITTIANDKQQQEEDPLRMYFINNLGRGLSICRAIEGKICQRNCSLLSSSKLLKFRDCPAKSNHWECLSKTQKGRSETIKTMKYRSNSWLRTVIRWNSKGAHIKSRFSRCPSSVIDCTNNFNPPKELTRQRKMLGEREEPSLWSEPKQVREDKKLLEDKWWGSTRM